jgi:PKD repeat protein
MLIILMFLISSLSINSVFAPKNRKPIADVGGPYSGTEGEAISFDGSGSNDKDGTIISFLWDFGDGETSTNQNPTHVYSQNGSYSVSLLVTDNENATDEHTTSVVVADTDPVSDFSASPLSGTEPLTVTFIDLSTSHDGIISWLWDFGDGQTSKDQNPIHEYTQGTYTVSLTITEADSYSGTETKTEYITVADSDPVSDFSASPTSGIPTLTVTFMDASASFDGVISWLWEFGDGKSSTEPNPTHSYTIGSFTVSLTIREEDGDTKTQTKPNYINVEPSPNSSPTADFIIAFSAMPTINGIFETQPHQRLKTPSTDTNPQAHT